MRFTRALVLTCCASVPLLAQHVHHEGSTPPPAMTYSAFGRWTNQSGPRGGDEFALTDWEHFQQQRLLGSSVLSLRAMTSVGALVDDRAGMPSLLQTGGSYRHGYIHDRQHPDDVLMELAAALRIPVGQSRSMSFYLAPVGEPALGPESYVHRPSAQSDPVAPIGHHWQDATHVSYGVVSAAVAASRLLFEASAFNGRESDFKDPWPDFSHARLDSYAGRLGIDIRPLMISGWWGYLKQHDPIAPAMQMHRYGASVALNTSGIHGGAWSSLAVWGMNVHHHDGSSHLLLHGDPNASPHLRSSSLLAESNLEIGGRHTVFARVERVVKNGEELGFLGGNLTQPYDVGLIAGGARRTFARMRFGDVALGGRGTLSFVPPELEQVYGSRRPMGVDLYLNVRRLR